MGYSNNIITAPVGIGDISQALSNSSTDLGTLCSSVPQSKKWAKYKPEHWNYLVHGSASPPIGYLTDTDRKVNHYGLDWFQYRIGSSGQTQVQSIASWRQLMLGTISGGLYHYNEVGDYFNGSSNVPEPKRIADFLAFKNNGTPYVDNDSTRLGYWSQVPRNGPVAGGRVMEWTYNSGHSVNDKITVNWTQQNANVVNFLDFVELGSDHLCFGVLFVRIPNYYTGTAYSILHGDNGSSSTLDDIVTLVWHLDPDEQPEDSYYDVIVQNSSPSSFITADDVYRAGLTPTPIGSTVEYTYIFTPVLFRRGLINDFNKGYCSYSLDFELRDTYSSIRAIPLPLSTSDMTPDARSDSFIINLESAAAASPDLDVIVDGFEAEKVEGTTNVTISKIYIHLTGPDDQSGFQWSREVVVKLYRGDDPADNPSQVTPINNYQWTITPTENSTYEIDYLNITLDYRNLRCCAYLTSSPTGYGLISDDVLIEDKASLSD